MPAKTVTGAILLAAAKADPVKIGDTQRLFAELGIGVAEGRFVWPEIKKKAPAPTEEPPMIVDSDVWKM